VAEVTMKLDKKRRFRLNLITLGLFEETTGIKLKPEISSLPYHAVVLLWGGLVQDDPALTIKEAKKLLISHYREVVKGLKKAFRLFKKERGIK